MNNFEYFVNDCIAENGWTPDVPFLDTRDDWYVFVYNNRRGKKSSYFTHDGAEAEFMSIGWTKSSIYSMLNVQDGQNEQYLITPHGTDRVLGEVWKIPTERVFDLDSDERNLMITRRLMIPVCLSKGHVVNAWTYIADAKYLIKGNLRINKHTATTYYGSDRFIELH